MCTSDTGTSTSSSSAFAAGYRTAGPSPVRAFRASVVSVVAGLALLSGSTGASPGPDRSEERALLGWAIHLSGHAGDAPLPAVRYVPPSFFAEHACAGRGECRVLGWYDDRHVVYIAETFRSLDSLFARSLLVHEFVHYLQHIGGRFAVHDCERFVEREREAYAVQQSFFMAYGAVPQVRARHYGCARLDAAPSTEHARLSSAVPDRATGD